ncbi:uncharacterized protein ALTATR162_LOCUS2562 [Alternaria atra]|uniref:Uncharacterized protein n=1 Tax=Alternaria atra TaxID=119953 RepID=A0A8J2HY82_9PLEO|nr:uncharacterized protein ALTATR162_LOCUS2562 [Alternaria atra]CAG5150147.1 unnamed protein product [Alternaria atra]
MKQTKVCLKAADAVLITLVAGICNALPTVLNGVTGSNLHIPFSIASRASFDHWLSYFAIVSRDILAMFWFGVQTANGGILFTDYWLVKHTKYDMPALYDPKDIYRYGRYGTNWHVAVATFVIIIPLLPGLANKVNPDLKLPAGLRNLFTFNWLYNFFLSIFLSCFCNHFFPAE